MSRAPRALSVRSLLAFLVPLLLLPGLAACTKDEDDPGPGGNGLPDGTALLTESAAAMEAVETVHIVLDISPPVGALPIERAEGDLERGGDAMGTIQLILGAQLIEVEFVVIGEDAWLKYPTGGWVQAGSIANIYDPSAILDPERGVANLLTTATNARTDGEETVGDVDTWRVKVDINQDAANTLVPGVPDGLTGTVWVDKESKRMVKAVVDAPASGASPAATITLEMTNFDAAVDISEPV
jgi:lipoprotein LprG